MLLDELAAVAAQEARALQAEEAEINARVQVQSKRAAVQDTEQGMYDEQFSTLVVCTILTNYLPQFQSLIVFIPVTQ